MNIKKSPGSIFIFAQTTDSTTLAEIQIKWVFHKLIWSEGTLAQPLYMPLCDLNCKFSLGLTRSSKKIIKLFWRILFISVSVFLSVCWFFRQEGNYKTCPNVGIRYFARFARLQTTLESYICSRGGEGRELSLSSVRITCFHHSRLCFAKCQWSDSIILVFERKYKHAEIWRKKKTPTTMSNQPI